MMMAEEAMHDEGAISPKLLKKFTKPELADFARMTYGLRIDANAYPQQEMVDLIMEAARKFKGNAEMKVVEMNEAVEVPKGYVKIRVSPGKYNPAARPIPLGLNFRMATIPCNKDVVMHAKWLPCLQDAVERQYAVQRDPDTGRESLGWSDQHKYPFSILVDNR